MASVTFTNCTVEIKQQVTDGGYGVFYEGGANSKKKQLPSELATKSAMVLWKKAQDAGWIDKDYQPNLSNPKAALLADYFGQQLKLTKRWEFFTELWDIQTLHKDFDKAFAAPSSTEFIDLIHEKLGEIKN